MSLGNSLFNARKKNGLSQEEVAEKLGVSRQTISKWELDETLPDIRQSKKLSTLFFFCFFVFFVFVFFVFFFEVLFDFSWVDSQQKIDWTQMWAKKYPVLTSYQKEVDTGSYVSELREMLTRLRQDYGYNDEDAFLVLKDILAHIWNDQKSK